MYVGLVRSQPRPGQAEEYVRRWKEILAPRARGLSGFRAAYFVGDGAANALTAIYIWDDETGLGPLDRCNFVPVSSPRRSRRRSAAPDGDPRRRPLSASAMQSSGS